MEMSFSMHLEKHNVPFVCFVRGCSRDKFYLSGWHKKSLMSDRLKVFFRIENDAFRNTLRGLDFIQKYGPFEYINTQNRNRNITTFLHEVSLKT